jgi:hypothetical protein
MDREIPAMTNSSRALNLSLLLALAGWLTAAGAPDARAITFGEPDCLDNASNTGCLHPNTVSVSGFRAPREGEDVDAVAFGRCSGSLLAKDPERIIVLSAGHCVSFFISAIADGTLIDIGVSFDAQIVRDIPDISSTSWSPDQYILGGTLVLPEEYGPQGLNAFNLHFDYGIVVLPVPAGGLVTHGGTPVDLSGIEPVTLPPADFLATIADVQDPPVFTAVGYGTGEAHERPGEGGNKGGAVNDSDTLGVRLFTPEGTAFVGFLGPNLNLMMGSQNPARDHTGTCGGDSGGPMFYDDGGTELQVAVTSSGDSICRGSAIMARTDAPEAQAFLGCAISARTLAQIENCGCTEVDSQGECP